MRFSAKYLLIFRDTPFLLFNKDGYEYLLNSDEFYFFIDNFFVSSGSIKDQLFHIENGYMLYEFDEYYINIERIDFSLKIKVKMKETCEVEEIFQILKEIVYFFKILRGFNPQIERIYLNNVKDIAGELKYDNVGLIINYDFQKRYFDEMLYLNKSKYLEVPIEMLGKKYKKWIALIYTHRTLMKFFINEYYLINDVFLDYCRLIEYIYDNFYYEVDESKIKQLEDDLERIYSDINFTEYISDSKFRKVYKRKIERIHFDVIARVIHDATLGKAPLSEKIKKVDVQNRIGNSNYSKDILIEETSKEFNIYLAINLTRNYYTHMKKEKELVINDLYLRNITDNLESIILDFFTNYLEIDYK